MSSENAPVLNFSLPKKCIMIKTYPIFAEEVRKLSMNFYNNVLY